MIEHRSEHCQREQAKRYGGDPRNLSLVHGPSHSFQNRWKHDRSGRRRLDMFDALPLWLIPHLVAPFPTRNASCPAALSQREEGFNGAAPAGSTGRTGRGRPAFGCRLFWCTADAAKVDKRTRSKWSRLLRYADEHKLNSEPLDLIKRKGCINSYAARFCRRLGRGT